MAYEPRGKVKTLLDAMRATPARIWTSSEAAQAMEVHQGSLTAHLDTVIRHGLLHRRLEGGRCQYALQPFAAPPAPPAPAPWSPPQMVPPRGNAAPPPIATRAPTATPAPAAMQEEQPDAVEDAAEAVPFNAALWSDGDLVIYGAQENEDGSFTLTRGQVAEVKRLIAWSAAA